MISLDLLIQGLLNGILLGGTYALLSVGLSLCFGVTRVTNSAHAAFALLGAYITYWLFVMFHVDPLLSMIVSFAVLFVAGAFTQKLIIARAIESPYLMLFTLTYFLGFTLENVMVLLWKGEFRFLATDYSSACIFVGNIAIPILRSIAFAISISVILILTVFLKYTYVGKAMRAVAQDRKAAALMGINVGRIYMITYAVAVGLAGVGGTLLGLMYTFYPGVNSIWLGKMYIMVILGGMGSMFGTFVASMLVGIFEVTSGVFISNIYGILFSWLAVFVVILVKPSGLLGGR